VRYSDDRVVVDSQVLAASPHVHVSLGASLTVQLVEESEVVFG